VKEWVTPPNPRTVHIVIQSELKYLIAANIGATEIEYYCPGFSPPQNGRFICCPGNIPAKTERIQVAGWILIWTGALG
jgi:hypothetical protein